MELFKKKDKRSDSRKEYDRAVEQLRMTPFGTADYEKQLKIVERLSAVVKEEEARTRKASPDAILGVSANLLGIGLVCNYEHLHNLTSKALNFVIKSKLR